ncbi:MAG: SPFH domain-containing protein [Candidatus Omnitrophota bacterium]
MGNIFLRIIVVIVIVILKGIRILYQYERGVVFTLGKFSHIKEPGLNWIIPVLQTMVKRDSDHFFSHHFSN